MAYLNQFVQKCHRNLLQDDTPECDNARAYLAKRNVKDHTLSLHTIGYCLSDEKIAPEVEYYGVDRKRDSHHRGFGYFMRERIIVPIYSEFNRLIGFATRKPSFQDGNTWWNLARPFRKNNHLFMLDKARKEIFKSNKAYIVEGYMDAIILYQEGLKEVVGLMGTILSPRKIGLIARYCDSICLCMDQDKNQAGQKAQEKSLCALREFDFYDSVYAVDSLPVGEDPDEYITRNGKDEFCKLERRIDPKEINSVYKKFLANNKKW